MDRWMNKLTNLYWGIAIDAEYMTVYFSTCSEWCIVFQWEFKFIGGQSNNLKEKSNDTNNVKIQACKMLKEKFFHHE